MFMHGGTRGVVPHQKLVRNRLPANDKHLPTINTLPLFLLWPFKHACACRLSAFNM